MSCECHQIGGRFIAEDPDCPAHGLGAQREAQLRQVVIDQCQLALRYGTPSEIERALLQATEYLQSL